MATKKKLLLQPIQGKFVQSIINGKIVRVWLVDPDTNEQGTYIDYNDAINLLALPHPVVCLAQVKGKDGKYLKQLNDDDLELIEKRKDEFGSGITSVVSENDSSTLAKLVDTQSELIKSQSAQLKAFESQLNDMKKLFEKMSKKAAK